MKELVTRTISGIAFTALTIFGILWHPISYGVLFSFFIALMQYEYINLSIGKKSGVAPIFLGIATGILLFVTSFLVVGYGYPVKTLLIVIIGLIATFISNLYVKGHNKNVGENCYSKSPFITNSIIYIALPFSLVNLIMFTNGAYSGKLLLSVLILIWATDVGAYCFGSTLGQRYGKRLFPSISPKKSWIGFFGGLFCSIVTSIAIHYLGILEISIINSIVISIIICIFAILGDLVESQFKRNHLVKDSGKIIPGHGGVLDRFDSALICFPVVIIYILFFT